MLAQAADIVQQLSEVITGYQSIAAAARSVMLRWGGHKPRKLIDFSKCGKLGEFLGNSVQPQGKIIANKVVLVCHSNICVNQLLTA